MKAKQLAILSLFILLSFTFFKGNAQFIPLTTQVIDIQCPGDSTGTVTVFAHVNDPSIIGPVTHPLFFQMTGPINDFRITTNNPNDTTATFTNLPEGNYVFTVTDATPPPNNKIGFGAIVIGGTSPLASNPSSNPVSCVGLSDGDAIVSTTGGTPPYSYAWNGLLDTDSIANDIPAGDYTVIITDDNNCTLNDTITVIEGDTLEARFSFANDCVNNNILISDSSIGVDGSTTYLWDFGINATPPGSVTPGDQNVIYSTPGSKTVRLTLDNGTCTHFLDQNITVFGLPSLTTSGDITICETETTPLTVSGAATYTWLPNDGSLSATNIPNPQASPTITTNYTVTGTDGNNCTNTANLTVTVNALPTVSVIIPNDTICENNSIQLTASGGTNYAWTPNDGSLSATNIPNPIATPTSTTTYKVIVTSGASCMDSTEFDIVVLPAPTLTISPDDAVCLNDSSQLIVTSSDPISAFDWFPKNGSLSSTSINNPFATPLTTTEYTAIVTASNTCIDSIKTTITVNTLPVITITSNDTICENESIPLLAGGGTGYGWTSNDGSLSNISIPNPIASPNTTTTYIVTVSDAIGCQNTDSVEIFVHPIPVAAITPTPSSTICIGQTTTLTASGGTNYNWLPGGQNTPAINVSPVADQLYQAIVSNGFNCSDTASITVTVNPLPIPTISVAPNDSICLGDSTTLTATGGVSYTWKPSTNITSTNTNITTVFPTANTTYKAIVTDVNNCIDSTTVLISVLSLPTITISTDDTICFGETRTLSATGGNTYAWSPSATLSDTTANNPIATPTSTTTYTVIARDLIGCENTDSTEIVVNPLPITTISNDTSICTNDTISLEVTGGISYSWNNGASLSDNTSPTPLAFPTTTTNYLVTSTDINNCSVLDSVLVTVNPLPTLVATPAIDTICRNTTTILSVSGANSYIWSPDSTLNTNTGSSVTASPNIDHIYTITGTDINGCQNTTTAQVLIEPVITIGIVQNDTICRGDTVTLSATVVNGVSFQWSDPTDIIDNPNQLTTRARPSVTQYFKLQVTNVVNCTNTDSLLVVVETTPTLNISADSDSICQGDSVLLVASGSGAGYVWSPPASFSTNDSVYVTPLATTTYVVQATTVGGCASINDTTIFVDPVPTVSVTNDLSYCVGDSAQLIATGGNSYTWSPNLTISSTTNDTVYVSPNTTTRYTVTASNLVGCTDTASVNVSVNNLPTVSISGDTSICIGDTSSITATSPTGLNFTWTPSDSLSSTNTNTTLAYPTNTTTYTVLVEDINTCTTTDSINVQVNSLPVIVTSSDETICEGQTANLIASGGTLFAWTPAATLTSPNSANTIATPLSTTLYSVTVTSLLGCIDSAQVRIEVNPAPTGTLTLSADTVCFGTQLSAQAVMDPAFDPNVLGAYSFDGGTTFTGIDQLFFTQTTSGDTTISVLFKDKFDCAVSSPVTITAHTLPEVTMQIDTIILPDCVPPPGKFKVFNVAGGLSPYTISLNGSTPVAYADSAIYDNLTPGTYIIDIFDAFGCTAQENLNFLSSITFDTTIIHPLCNGNTNGLIEITNVQGGVAPYEFSKTDTNSFSTNGRFENLGAGLHNIFLKDQGNCLIDLNFNLTEPLPLIADSIGGNKILCNNTTTGRFSLSVTGGSSPFTVDNSIVSLNGTGPFTFVNLSPGTQNVLVTDSNNCTTNINYTIEDALPIEAFFTEINPPSGCNTADGSVTLDSTINGTQPYGYSIDGGTTFRGDSLFKLSLTALTSGIYQVIVEDNNLCRDTSTFTLTTANGVELDSIITNSNQPTCIGDDGSLSISNLFGAPKPYTFKLLLNPTDTILADFQLDSSFTGLEEGSYDIIIRDDLGCDYPFNGLNIAGPQKLTFTSINIDAKCGMDNGTIIIQATGGSGSYDYSINNGVTDQRDSIFNNLAADSYIVQVTDTIDPSCFVGNTEIIGTSTTDALLDTDSISCFGANDGQMIIDRLTNTDTSNYIYTFSITDTLSFGTDTIFSNLSGGLHTLYINQFDKRDSSSCFYADKETYINETIENVFYDTITLSNFFIGSPELLSAGVNTMPSTKGEADGLIFINAISGGIAPYLFSIKDSTKFFTYSNLDTVRNNVTGIAEGEYIVYVKDQNNCLLEVPATVGRRLYIPNIFTPNGDGVNDLFFISNLPQGAKLRVYDKWGILSYQSHWYENDWDGKNQPDGVYFYEIEVPTKIVKGWVQIVRN